MFGIFMTCFLSSLLHFVFIRLEKSYGYLFIEIAPVVMKHDLKVNAEHA